MQKIWFFLIIVTISIIYTGCSFDQTTPPKPSDIIVSLGGKGDYRKQKAMSLLEQNYSNTSTMIQTGNHVRIFIYKDGNITEGQFPKTETKNTMAEIHFIKSYLLEHNLRSALIVSDPPHSRRILFFAETLHGFSESGLSLSVVASDPHWWGPEPFRTSPYAHEFIWMESLKYLFYTMAYYLGFLDENS